MIRLQLPWPPSVNHYYRHDPRSGRTLISRQGRSYRVAVLSACIEQMGRIDALEGRLSVLIDLEAPDKRRRDIDNVQKAVLDALQHAGMYGDDEQIDRLVIVRGVPCKGGRCTVGISVIEPGTESR